jgi:hypothetical protein
LEWFLYQGWRININNFNLHWNKSWHFVWYLDLQLPVQSVPITTKVVSLNPVLGKVYSYKSM